MKYLLRTVRRHTDGVIRMYLLRTVDGELNSPPVFFVHIAHLLLTRTPTTTATLLCLYSEHIDRVIMSEEAKTSEVAVAVPTPDVHADTQPKVSKYNQSENPIPKVVPPRGSKDARSFRPSTLAEINMMNRYEPLELKIGGKTYGIGCGNSLEDVLLITGCILALWSFILGVSGLLLKSAIDTDRCVTSLHLFLK